jgi:hypothetical protein
VREEVIDAQLRAELKGVSLPPALAAEALDNIKKVSIKAAQAGEEAAQNLRDEIVILNQRMNAILDMLLGGQLTQDEYAQKKRSFVEKKMENEMKLAAFGRIEEHSSCGRHLHSFALQGDLRFEPLMGFYRTAVLAGESSVSGNPAENLQILKNIGSNFFIGGKRISFKLKSPWEKLQKFNFAEGADFGKNRDFKFWGALQTELITYFAQHPEESL